MAQHPTPALPTAAVSPVGNPPARDPAVVRWARALQRAWRALRQGDVEPERLTAPLHTDDRLAALVRHGSDMLMILEMDTTVRYASPSHERVMGVRPDALVGMRMDGQIHRDDMAKAGPGFDRLRSGESMQEALIVRLRDGNGSWRWIEAVGTNLFSEPSIGGLVLNSRDITDRKQLEAQLIELALRDPLTGLGNRRLFSDRVTHALERRVRRGSRVAMLMLDLDHFKVVNDTFGHARGDALLVAVAERLQCVLRTGDTVARLGGDEFAVLLEDLSHDDEAEATALRIQQALDRAFRLDEREMFIRASIGIAWATDGQDVDALLADADVAMYGAKNSGRGRVERYSSEMRASVAERVDLEADLRVALERGELDLVYQPVVDLETGCVTGAEALIRWTHPQHGMVLPGRFIPVAEESELIIDIGRFVIQRAAVDAARFRVIGANATHMRVGVNLSARHLLSPELITDVRDALDEAGVGGTALSVELTEAVLASNEPVVGARLQGLRDLGVHIALDDFGTGYSSLAYLRRFPIDVLKVDKSFVSYAHTEAVNDGVAKAIVSIGQSLGMRTVAEGVETLEQLDRLRGIGCALGQGYLFARPLAREAFERLLLDWTPATFARRTEALPTDTTPS
jgi:diguanylate cyclase (GGDEF)-like protein/PAS domain S-box-containing protein